LFPEEGRPGNLLGSMIRLLLLKRVFAPSDEQICERRLYDCISIISRARSSSSTPCRTHSDLSHWRGRRGAKLKLLLVVTLRIAYQAGPCAPRAWCGSRSTPPCSPRRSASRPTPSCCTPLPGPQSAGQKAPRAAAAKHLRLAKRAAIMGSATPMRNSSSATSCNCASCMHGSAASFATWPQDRRPRRSLKLCFAGRWRAQHKCAGNSSASAVGSFILPRTRGRMHRQGQSRSALYELDAKASITTTDAAPPSRPQSVT
jgi:hypothetical protein